MPTPREWDDFFMTAAARCEPTPVPTLAGPWEDWDPFILLKDVLRMAGEMFHDQFTVRDFERLGNGQTKWENNLYWAYKRLRGRELVRRVARGRLNITELGWQRVR